VLTLVRRELEGAGSGNPETDDPEQVRADIAAEVQAAITDVLVAKSVKALQHAGRDTLVVAGGVSANRRLRERLAAEQAKSGGRNQGFRVHFPELSLCSDNGAMIAFAGGLRLAAMQARGELARLDPPEGFQVRPRWPLDALEAA